MTSLNNTRSDSRKKEIIMDIKDKSFAESNMGKAIIELNEIMIKQNMRPVELNVIGGFAMMMHGTRDITDHTDIDYIGKSMSKTFDKIADKIGIKYGLGTGWINNDVMLSGISIEDFEFATGKLHFEPSIQTEKIKINILTEPDLLRMKMISVDTALTAIDDGGDFSRMKDIPDILKLMERTGMSYNDMLNEFGTYIKNPRTIKTIQMYKDNGTADTYDFIQSNTQKTTDILDIDDFDDDPYKESDFLSNIDGGYDNYDRYTGFDNYDNY